MRNTGIQTQKSESPMRSSGRMPGDAPYERVGGATARWQAGCDCGINQMVAAGTCGWQPERASREGTGQCLFVCLRGTAAAVWARTRPQPVAAGRGLHAEHRSVPLCMFIMTQRKGDGKKPSQSGTTQRASDPAPAAGSEEKGADGGTIGHIRGYVQ